MVIWNSCAHNSCCMAQRENALHKWKNKNVESIIFIEIRLMKTRNVMKCIQFKN